MHFFTREKDFYKRFLTMTFAIAFQNIIVFSVNLADNIMLGAYDEVSLAGVALVNQIQFFLQMIIMGVSEGIIVFASRAWGRGEIDPIKKVGSIGMRIGVGMSLLLFGLVFLFPTWTLSLLTNEAAVIAEAEKYLRIICFSYLFFAMTNVLLGILRSVETVKIGFMVSASTLVVNVCLNYILIYGNFGAPRLGVRGAAIATLTARVLEFVITFLYTRYADHKIRIRLGDFKTFDLPAFRQYFKVSFPMILSNALWGLAMAVQTAILGRLGGSAIAASSIATTILQILSVVTYGSGSASSVIISKKIGELGAEKNGDIQPIKEYVRTMQVLYLVIGVLTGLGLYFSKNALLSFYTISPETRALSVQFMNILAITIVGTSYQMAALTGIVRGGGDTKFVLYNDLIFMWLIVLPLSALAAFALHLSPAWVFLCLKSDQVLKCFVAVVKVNRYTWIRRI